MKIDCSQLLETARENSPTCTVCGRKAWEHQASECTHDYGKCGCKESEIDRHYRMMTASKPKTSAGDSMQKRLHNLKMERGDLSVNSSEYQERIAAFVESFFGLNGEARNIKSLINQYGLIAFSHCLVAVADSNARNPMGMLISKLRSGSV